METDGPSVAAEGLRARKQRQTSQRIIDAAVDLFLRQGFEQTTLNAISEAADISRRTFFHYFPSKDDILQQIERAGDDVLRAGVLGAAAGASPIAAARAALFAMLDGYDRERAGAIDRLIKETEALRVRKQAGYIRQEAVLLAALEERFDDYPNPKLALRITAMIAMGLLRIAADQWSEDRYCEPLSTYLTRAFDELDADPLNMSRAGRR